MCDAPSTWRASTCAMLWRSRSAAYEGLMAAPGTPKALVTPSFSITSTAAIAAFIFAMSVSFELVERTGEIVAAGARRGNATPRRAAIPWRNG